MNKKIKDCWATFFLYPLISFLVEKLKFKEKDDAENTSPDNISSFLWLMFFEKTSIIFKKKIQFLFCVGMMVDHIFLQAAAKYLDCNIILIMSQPASTDIVDRIVVLKGGPNGKLGSKPPLHLGYLEDHKYTGGHFQENVVIWYTLKCSGGTFFPPKHIYLNWPFRTRGSVYNPAIKEKPRSDYRKKLDTNPIQTLVNKKLKKKLNLIQHGQKRLLVPPRKLLFV